MPVFFSKENKNDGFHSLQLRLYSSLLSTIAIICSCLFCQGCFNSDPTKFLEGKPVYDQQLSEEITKLYKDSLGKYLEPTAKIYKDSTGRNLAIFVEFELKANFFENQTAYDLLNQRHLELLASRLEKGTYQGAIKYSYSSATGGEIREKPIVSKN